jgi:hypothetical protein
LHRREFIFFQRGQRGEINSLTSKGQVFDFGSICGKVTNFEIGKGACNIVNLIEFEIISPENLKELKQDGRTSIIDVFASQN